MDKLRKIMQSVGIYSYRELSQLTGVSEKQLRRLRRGEIQQLRLTTLDKISRGLKISITELLEAFGVSEATSKQPEQVWEQEYKRLQSQLESQKEVLIAEFHQSSLQIIESWLLQWGTVAYAVKQNPQIPAERLLKLVQPIEQLIRSWGIEAIAEVGTELPYDPQYHQLMDGAAKPGDLVKVRYTGYKQRDKLLYRAKVSPIA
jgi:DNA-binding Xre family transcriptional regulator